MKVFSVVITFLFCAIVILGLAIITVTLAQAFIKLF